MVVYRRGTHDLWGPMGIGWADNVRGRLVGPAVIRTTSRPPVVGWCSLSRGRRHAAGRGAHSRRPLLRSELTTQQLSLRRRCGVDRLVGDGPRPHMSSQPLKSSLQSPAPGDPTYLDLQVRSGPKGGKEHLHARASLARPELLPLAPRFCSTLPRRRPPPLLLTSHKIMQ